MNIEIIVPGSVDLPVLERIYGEGLATALSPDAKPKVDQAAQVVAKAAVGSDAVYGINTGFGKLAQTRIDASRTETLQRNLILSHCCGVGEPMPRPLVRLMMSLKLNSLGRGASGVRWELIVLLQDMVAKDVIPHVPAQGSVGASGDLAPLAHMAAAMMGEGKAYHEGKLMPAGEALVLARLEPIVLQAKEGLALINGTQFSCAYALAAFFDTWRLAQSSLITGALATDAAMGSSAPFHPEIHALRGHQGQIDVAATLRVLMENSILRESHRVDDERVQDPYCLRCQPQVVGACIDMLRHVGRVLAIEANAVTDNPLIVDGGAIISGGNFHAEPVAFAADQMAIAISELGAIAQRRISTLVDPALNSGLPAFLSPDPGINSGFMIAEVTSAALMSENKQRTMPASVDSTPTSANQEDHVSMAAHGARRLMQMNENLAMIIAIEWLVASQGIELRAPLTTSPLLSGSIAKLRTKIPALQNDRYMADDLAAACEQVSNGDLVRTVPNNILPQA